jgi:hypothetical protein
VQKTILKLTRVYFEGVQLAGSLLSGLKPYYPVMVAKFVDAVLETVTVALDDPRTSSQQRYLTSLKLVGELYNYKVVDNLLVFSVLYAIINRGHALRPGTRSYSNALRLCVVNPSTDLGLPEDSTLSGAELGPGKPDCLCCTLAASWFPAHVFRVFTAFVAALGRVPSVGASGRPIDDELAAVNVCLPVDPAQGGWGFHPLVPCASDPPTNMFRIRMVCMLLDTSGVYFCKGALKLKMDVFLSYFQVSSCLARRVRAPVCV